MAIKTPQSVIIDATQDATLHKNIEAPSPKKVEASDKFRLTWKKDKPDSRDYIYKAPSMISPQSVDMRQYCTTVENQGNLGSCTGNAIAGAIELINKRNGRPTDISRLFIYYNERLLEGTVNYDSGAYIRDGLKVVNKQGAPLEKYWRYDISKYRVRPSVDAYNDALNRKVTRYERCLDFNAVIDAITNKNPVVIGFLVYSSFFRIGTNGMMQYPNVSREALLGGHAVCLVGYDKARKVFIARNSWGSGWGDRGYFYMPFSVIQNSYMSSDFWTISTVANPL